jgi:hypothetical protein
MHFCTANLQVAELLYSAPSCNGAQAEYTITGHA